MTDDLDREWMPPADLSGFDAAMAKVVIDGEPDPPVTEQTIAADVRNDALPEENQ